MNGCSAIAACRCAVNGAAPCSAAHSAAAEDVSRTSDTAQFAAAKFPACVPFSDRERCASKLKALNDRLVQWLTLPGEAGSVDRPLRHFHIGVLLVHLDMVYDLVEGVPVAFVWKVRNRKGKSRGPSLQPAALLAWPAALFAAGLGKDGGASSKAEEEDGGKESSGLLLTKVTIALSSDLKQLEVHHAHEVQMVPLNQVTDIWEGLNGKMGALDECCAVVELPGNHQCPFRFFERSLVRPFISIVLALSRIAKESEGGTLSQRRTARATRSTSPREADLSSRPASSPQSESNLSSRPSARSTSSTAVPLASRRSSTDGHSSRGDSRLPPALEQPRSSTAHASRDEWV